MGEGYCHHNLDYCLHMYIVKARNPLPLHRSYMLMYPNIQGFQTYHKFRPRQYQLNKLHHSHNQLLRTYTSHHLLSLQSHNYKQKAVNNPHKTCNHKNYHPDQLKGNSYKLDHPNNQVQDKYMSRYCP